MSREYLHEYAIKPSALGLSIEDAMYRLVDAVEACLSPCHWGAGAADQERGTVVYWFAANLSKGARLAQALDAYLGIKGALTFER